MNIIRIIPITLLLISFACTDLPKLENIDLNKWKEDRDACNEYRIQIIDTLLIQKDKLRGLSQNEMIQLLGTADRHQLFERSQKFFIYYLNPNENCEQYAQGYLKALYIRFNSLDQAVEFSVQKLK
jgi:hypothetical protein